PLRSGSCDVVAEAANGVDAVALARETRPDVAVFDVSMPRLNGVEVVRRIRADSQRREFSSSACTRIATDAARARGVPPHYRGQADKGNRPGNDDQREDGGESPRAPDGKAPGRQFGHARAICRSRGCFSSRVGSQARVKVQ